MGKPSQGNDGGKGGKMPDDNGGDGIENGQQEILCLIDNEKENGQQQQADRIKV